LDQEANNLCEKRIVIAVLKGNRTVWIKTKPNELNINNKNHTFEKLEGEHCR
jgi:hypothetical protein